MKAFFDAIRAKFGPFNQSQVDGFNQIVSLTDGLPLKHQAYMLATVWHECAGTMQPITERGGSRYFDKYEPGTRIGKALGNTIKGDGARFKGRGYVQITGRANYVRASKVVGEDLVANPELALRPDFAAQIMTNGMLNGWFTGKKLSDYSDYRDMRRVINGTDKAVTIAGYAEVLERALLARAKEGVEKPVQPPRGTGGAEAGGAVVAIGGAAVAAQQGIGWPWIIAGLAVAAVIAFIIWKRRTS